ncbi:hypothetical protein TIFTF001_011865 [Ficus carica]|uniref:Uncharacterized protein n=1 Tax=Ficus carica TaxID=3494 RepID=A0AA88D4P1_FICCA|nr:hypothetical protein TIFTF001_011865 [Ficus carica]
MASWNLIPLVIAIPNSGLDCFYFLAFQFLPTSHLEFPVVGLNFDYVVLNLTKHTSYLICIATLYFSSDFQQQYFDKYGFKEMIPVAANDVAFSIHSVLLVLIMLLQIAIYERGGQTVSKVTRGLSPHSIQVLMTAIKYSPQAFMNFKRKSTDGFCIYNILLDFTGSVANYSQMAVQSMDQSLSS